MYYVYVIKSYKNERHYIGHTNNLKRRIHEHNSGQSKYTKLRKEKDNLSLGKEENG
ncbi:MAG: hypothetical protein UY37_C0009G0003 [Candidatus Beckwithbacteria bacterium GW2011_GWC2_49_11]|nr:MAG: hypothetical protein UY37_C0009G0003 [Candidatus Beckwithbacteria bacterium GW2011_GWC2_49_11]